MEEIVESIKRVTDIVSEITAASQEQTDGIEQINQAIAQMDEVTQQNAALVEEAAAASQALQDQAGNLAQVVSVFKLDGVESTPAAALAAVESTQQVAAPKRPSAAVVPLKSKRTAPLPVAAGGEWEEF